MALADEIRKLDELRQSGALSEDEYARAKARVIDGGAASGVQSASPYAADPAPPADIERQTRQWGMLLHLSLLAGFLLPIAGLIVPVVIWVLKKDELPGVDVHGKNALNWIISVIIYGVASGILIIVVIGVPLLLILVVLSIVFPIIAALKANNGEYWKYPLSISFLT
jgi:uncharacterized protein